MYNSVMHKGESISENKKSESEYWLGENVPEFAGNKKTETLSDLDYSKKLSGLFNPLEFQRDLNDKKRLKDISNSYLNQYGEYSHSESRDLAFKESLDHYILERLSGNDVDKFVSSKEFKSYSKYILNIATSKTIQSPSNELLYPEFLTNPVLKNEETRKLVLKGAYYLKNTEKINRSINQQINSYQSALRNTEACIDSKSELSQFQIDLIGDYLYSSKNINVTSNNSLAEKYVGYCYNDISEESSIKPSTQMLGALGNYFAKLYTIDEDVKGSSRIIIANLDGIESNGVSTTFGCFLPNNKLLQMSLTADSSLNKSRTLKGNDLYSFMMACFHELTHDHQRNLAKKGDRSSSAMAHILNQILRDNSHDRMKGNNATNEEATYCQLNHDNDETEIEADEEAWRQCRNAIDHIEKGYVSRHKEEYEHIVPNYRVRMSLCKRNEIEVGARRAFTHKLSETRKAVNSVEYDIEGLKMAFKTRGRSGIMSRYPYPQLQEYINWDGELKPECLFDTAIAETPQDSFSLEVGTYMLVHEKDKIKEYISNNKDQITTEQAEQLMTNLCNIINQNTSRAKSLEGINRNNYDETDTLYKNANIEDIQAYYFKEYLVQCFNAILLSEQLKTVHPELSEYISFRQERSIGNQYHELPNKNKLDSGFLQNAISGFTNSQHPVLLKLATMIKESL